VETAEFRTGLVSWLHEHRAELDPPFVGVGTLDEQMVQLSRVKRALFDAGWMRWGWPESVGGLGGSSILRAVLGEEVTGRGLVEAGFYSMTEVLAPTLAEFAPMDLAREEIPKLLRGDVMWCQGFSEPGTGSDLSSLSCRAMPSDGHWVVNGQKLWTSLAQYSSRCVLLTRTGPPGSAHRGITAFFVDMDTPGITVRPFALLNGAPEFAEVFFDDVVVPADRILGDVNGGWAVAMNILPFERSTSFWHRTAFLARRMQQLVDRAPDDVHSATVLGEAFQQVYAMRARSRLTQYRLAEQGTIGPETSVDKILVATAEQQLFDAARQLLPGVVELDDSPDGAHWRSEFLYSRAATIYGGSAEIQRNIVARRLLDLGPEA
jgi:alkylation response protein AidB-like acyl-CoA dehydrogenase